MHDVAYNANRKYKYLWGLLENVHTGKQYNNSVRRCFEMTWSDSNCILWFVSIVLCLCVCLRAYIKVPGWVQKLADRWNKERRARLKDTLMVQKLTKTKNLAPESTVSLVWYQYKCFWINLIRQSCITRLFHTFHTVHRDVFHFFFAAKQIASTMIRSSVDAFQSLNKGIVICHLHSLSLLSFCGSLTFLKYFSKNSYTKRKQIS